MKKICFTLLLALTIGFAGYSQKTTFGVKAAVTSNYLSITDEEDDLKVTGSKTGFYAGGVANFQLSKHLALQPNLLVALKGAEFEDMNITSWHIEVPINLLYTRDGFFVGAGPNFSYGLSGEAKTDLEPDGAFDIYAEDESDFKLHRFEAGANVLMGYTFPNGISLSASYAQGFNNIFRGENDHIYTVHSKTFGFSVGYMFGARKG